MGAEPLPAQLIAGRASLAVLRDDATPPSLTALGGGQILLSYAGLPTLIARLDTATPERVEPISVLPDPPRGDDSDYSRFVFPVATGAFLARPGLLEYIGATGDAVRVASGVTLAHGDGTLAVDASGRLHALATRSLPGGARADVVLDCNTSHCDERPFPAGVAPRQIFLTEEDKVGVVESHGIIGLFTR
jgi:hypothetical protein